MFTAQDYVQDGLLAMFDGVENIGFGQHSENPSSVFTAGSYDGVPFVPHDVVFDKDHFKFNGSTSYISANSWNLANSIKCIESVFKFDANKSGMIFQSSKGGSNDSTYGKPEMCWHTSLGFIVHAANTATPTTRRPTYPCLFSEVGSITQASVLFDKENSTEFYKEGVSLSGATGNNNGNNVSRCAIGANGDLSSYFLNGKIYCLRLYDRLLSDQERRKNLAIDKARFGLPDAV